MEDLQSRVRRRIDRLGRHALKRAQALAYLVRRSYRPASPGSGLSFSHLGIPATAFRPRAQPIVHTVDFMSNGLTFSGTPFGSSPHVRFAEQYLGAAGFDYRSTEYYQRAVRGNLPFPGRGVENAESRCRQFIHLIEAVRADGYCPERGAVTFVEYGDRDVMVLDGKHRLAALLALGVEEFPAVFCFENEVKAFFHDAAANAWPAAFYTTSLNALRQIGRLNRAYAREIAELVDQIRGMHLETWAPLYHPIPFLEFGNLATQLTPEAPYRRLSAILARYDDFRGLRLLDLGCNLGFYSFSLARRGAIARAIDLRHEYIAVGKRLTELYDEPVQFFEEAISEELVLREPEVDLTLFFSVLQWIVEQQGQTAAAAVLRAISRRSAALMFDVAVNDGKSRLTCAPGQEIAFGHNLLRSSTTYRHVEYVGDVVPYGGRPRHMFYCYH